MSCFENLEKKTRISDLPIYKALQKEGGMNTDLSDIDRPIAYELKNDKDFTMESALYGGFDDEYIQNGFDYVSVSDVKNEVNRYFENFSDGAWKDLPNDRKMEIVKEWATFVGDKIGIKEMPDIVFYNNERIGEYGSYRKSDNTIRLNEYMMDNADKTFNTVAHELWHAHQHECAAEPHTFRDIQYRYNFDHYISPDVNYDLYRNQLVESEACAFADYFTQNVQDVLRRA